VCLFLRYKAKMKKTSLQKGKDETRDTFYHGRILVCQKKTGYRFAVDAPLLADFIQTTNTDRCLELGTGCGIISLLLSIKPFLHISNPPYTKAQAGRLSATPEKSIAKHELKCDILGVMQKTAALLKKKGRAYFVFTAKRKAEFFRAVEEAGLIVTTIRTVYPREGTQPNFLLARCVFPPSHTEFRNLPPLFLFDDAGDYTPETKEIFAGRTHAPSF